MSRRKHPHKRSHPPAHHKKAHKPQGTPSQRGAPPRAAAPARASDNTVEGVLQLRGKFGFILSEKQGQPDVYVEGRGLRLAMNGDRVVARVTSAPGAARPAGEILRVVERARNTLVGLFKMDRQGDLMMPEGGGEPVRVLDKNGLTPEDGQWVVLKITRWPEADAPAAGALQQVLGWPDDPGVDVEVIVQKHELPQKFPDDAWNQARAYGDSVPDQALEGRTTFFHLPVFTIDGADAKDFDDAVSIEPLPQGGARLGVHIADVAHYVSEGSALDQEALRRATSVYLVDRVIPMLPPNLSDHLCSLRPHVTRLTLSCVMDVDARGHVTQARLYESAIKSARRFTYEEVEAVLRGADDMAPAEVTRDVRRMGELAKVLRARRSERGSLDFDFPEPKVILDAAGRPLSISKRDRLDSHKLIEEFMLLANESVAALMKDFPFLYRIHPRPDPQKLAKLRETLQAVGVPVPKGFDEGHSMVLQKVLASVKGKPVEALVHTLLLRSLKQAVYAMDNVGHYGLASPLYTHFTSPIRRYPDLAVHRLIREHLRRQLSQDRQARWRKDIPAVAARSSQRERLAQEAERESVDLKRVQFMEQHVGDVFDGVIAGVTAFGFFVQLKEIFVEGLVHVRDLQGDYYFFDEVRHVLRGRRTGQIFRMGDPVRVKVAAANVAKRQLDFAWEAQLRRRGP